MGSQHSSSPSKRVFAFTEDVTVPAQDSAHRVRSLYGINPRIPLTHTAFATLAACLTWPSIFDSLCVRMGLFWALGIM